MKKLIQKYAQTYMIRPIIYKVFARFMISLTLALLWNRLVNKSGYLSVQVDAFAFLGVFYILTAWLAYLRLDGVNLPKFLSAWPPRGHKKPMRSYGDMADFTDEKPISFEELEDDERDVCCLIANAFCAIVFIIISII